MLNFSKTVGYGIQILSMLGEPGQPRLSALRLAERLLIPRPYLAKVVNRLSHTDLVDTQRGPGGGLVLKRASSEISLYDVVQVFDPKAFDQGCLLGMAPSTASRFCPCQKFFDGITDEIEERLRCFSIADLIQMRTGNIEIDEPFVSRSPVSSDAVMKSDAGFSSRRCCETPQEASAT